MSRLLKVRSKKFFLLAPLAGVVLFVVLYFIATLLYPGGSQIDKKSVGFSWINNYWCNLLNEDAINGLHNSAKPVAITAMFILCLTLSLFWLLFPRHALLKKKLRLIIQICGTVAMVIGLFLFTNINHDLIINLASAFGVIATIATFVGLYKIKSYTLFALGILNIVFVALNNYFYYTKDLIIYLPLLQKITFASFLIWISWIHINLYRMFKQNESNKNSTS